MSTNPNDNVCSGALSVELREDGDPTSAVKIAWQPPKATLICRLDPLSARAAGELAPLRHVLREAAMPIEFHEHETVAEIYEDLCQDREQHLCDDSDATAAILSAFKEGTRRSSDWLRLALAAAKDFTLAGFFTHARGVALERARDVHRASPLASLPIEKLLRGTGSCLDEERMTIMRREGEDPAAAWLGVMTVPIRLDVDGQSLDLNQYAVHVPA